MRGAGVVLLKRVQKICALGFKLCEGAKKGFIADLIAAGWMLTGLDAGTLLVIARHGVKVVEVFDAVVGTTKASSWSEALGIGEDAERHLLELGVVE